ncbi:NDP-hexose 2,3-dehydratase family protein [Streptomyces sp. ST2-7A]|uniref:NDP-hexose 2,3-dehydratase family protein n=1 Tax=Streptomyces sp. ST2-7A TaxID=2907214 RepID=UPI001F28508F|nr:NDP-hexose 2,3-dehydratase family protein [Streptomyces sp. ST2-7A]MCE7080557.1 NDP-hexose 2,3-dehydratase family protein [Streptomyces sp. ST2-7A]
MSQLLPSRLSRVADDRPIAPRIAESASVVNDGALVPLDEFHRRYAERKARGARVKRIPLDSLDGWRTDSETGDLVHESGAFFRVQGLSVLVEGAPVPAWSQPIINQSEIGILGLLVKDFNGVLHCLVQMKAEPGNSNGLQISPTVQATRSNYTRVHGGRPVPYLSYFRETGPYRVVADVLQSEQGAWFYQKRNRNMVVETTGDVPLVDGFAWLTIGQLHALLNCDDLLNMDIRTVLSCLPFTDPADPRGVSPAAGSGTRAPAAVGGGNALHSTGDILSWITESRTGHRVDATLMPLRAVEKWRRDEYSIAHESGRFFRVMAVRVLDAGEREVRQWSQPMIEPCGLGIVAFLVKEINGVPHVLVHSGVEPGYLDVVELGPTVMCTPENYADLPPEALPRYLEHVLEASGEDILFEATLSEEGGRFHHARNRYLIIRTDIDHDSHGDPDYRWMTLSQLSGLLLHSHYVNVQARSLIACLRSLVGA